MSTTIANVTCVAVRGRGIVIEGVPGSGKSELALALIDRGAILVGDDGMTVEVSGGQAIASPPPNIGGKLEVRGVGIIDLPATSAPIGLVLRLVEDAPRYPLEMDTSEIAGVAIPCLPFAAGDALQALRAEYALEKHGLPLPHEGGKNDMLAP
ncbi:HPr kinase/phosphorylase [Qipengyuania gaetbuli]|uniref:HPr kinase/phosphorylase n=1 Tax=Qipengyuania gaetbuli TaxID=266952 RepID=UPI001CD58C28|nr:HPr kinase/phosphatase C-terminal domain-containing protein [Qipengyuania gaetbuli]MCA0909444.1 HPr kinase/phosphatase C-terminal domain-containing protein [Qipengyuania gaetbuli]